MSGLAIFGILLFLALVILLPQIRWRPKPQCPECESTNLKEEREQTSMHVTDNYSGGSGGGYTTIRTHHKVTYHCQQCGHHWTVNEIDTR